MNKVKTLGLIQKCGTSFFILIMMLSQLGWGALNASAGTGSVPMINAHQESLWNFAVAGKPGTFNKSSPVNAATQQPSTLTLKWGASAQAISYDYCLGTTPCTTASKWISTGSATSKAVSGLIPGAQYYWQVRASNVSGITYANAGTLWTFTVIILSPTHVQASDGTYTTKVLVTWTAVPGATSYKVYRAASALATKSLVGSPAVTSFSDTTATAGATYYYWVAAYRGTHNSKYSTYDTGWRSLVAPPTNVTASDGKYTTKVLVSWSAVPGATSYKVYRALSATGTKSLTGSPTVTTYNDTSATPGVAYYYWVLAYKGTNKSGYSASDAGWRTDPHISGWTGIVVPSVPQALVSACQSEGVITIIATPDNWANYGQILADFVSTTGASINSINPYGGSADELAAIAANKGNKGPQAPDIVDVGYAYGAQGIAAGDFQPYKVQTWDQITDPILGIPAKDPTGLWTGGYYGVIALEINTDIVTTSPTNWSDLLDSRYAGQVALKGDPTVSSQGQLSVFASALGNGGSLDNAQPGLDFFHSLNLAGNFAGVSGDISNVATPIDLGWDYLAFSERDTFAGHPHITVVYPSPTIASLYVQAISKYAPHPNCAKVWMEIIHADEGQLAWMEGYTHVSNQADMETRGVIPPDLLAKLPPSSAYASAVSPTADQLTAAKALISAGWTTIFSAPVAAP